MSQIRVVLVDDHPVVRAGITEMLSKDSDIQLVGQASNGEECLRLIAETSPNILLLDLELPDMPGIQLAKLVLQDHPQVKILGLSAHDDPIYVKGILELGASGYLLKEEAPEFILEAVRGVAQGEQGWVSRRITAQITSWMQTGDPDETALTAREKEVLRLVVKGKTNQAIAQEMEISEKTVEKYMGMIFTKLKVASRVAAAVQAVRDGLV